MNEKTDTNSNETNSESTGFKRQRCRIGQIGCVLKVAVHSAERVDDLVQGVATEMMCHDTYNARRAYCPSHVDEHGDNGHHDAKSAQERGGEDDLKVGPEAKRRRSSRSSQKSIDDKE